MESLGLELSILSASRFCFIGQSLLNSRFYFIGQYVDSGGGGPSGAHALGSALVVGSEVPP